MIPNVGQTVTFLDVSRNVVRRGKVVKIWTTDATIDDARGVRYSPRFDAIYPDHHNDPFGPLTEYDRELGRQPLRITLP